MTPCCEEASSDSCWPAGPWHSCRSRRCAARRPMRNPGRGDRTSRRGRERRSQRQRHWPRGPEARRQRRRRRGRRRLRARRDASDRRQHRRRRLHGRSACPTARAPRSTIARWRRSPPAATCISTPMARRPRTAASGPRAAGIPGVVRGLGCRAREVRQAAVARAGRARRCAGTRRRRCSTPSTRSEMASVTRRWPTSPARCPRRTCAPRRHGRDAAHVPQARRHHLREGRDLATAGSRGHARGDRRRRRRRVLPRPARPRRLASRVAAMGGIWTEADLAGYKAVEREPIRFTLPRPRRHHACRPRRAAASPCARSWPRPRRCTSSGSTGTRVDRIHLYVEALRRIFADSTQLLGDPDFVDIPLTTILDTGYIPKRMANIDRAKATPSARSARASDRPSTSRRRTSPSSTPPAWRSPTPTR